MDFVADVLYGRAAKARRGANGSLDVVVRTASASEPVHSAQADAAGTATFLEQG